MEAFRLRTMAKINLGLDVVRRLENGYHQVKMIMQTVELYDELTFRRIETGIELEVEGEKLPGDERNLAYRAAKLIFETHTLPGGVRIGLKKRIPMAAGMAGGSSDAACVFHGIDRLYGLGMDIERMRKLAVQIGADVPFCITGGTMRSEGIGEILTPLPRAPKAYLVIAKPDIFVSTKYVYENLHVDRIEHHPDMDSVEKAIRGGDLEGMCASMENILEQVTERKYPVISRIKAALKRQGALTALMSGSGPSVFGIFQSGQQAQAAARAVKEEKLAEEVFVTGFAEKSCFCEQEFSDMVWTEG